MLVVRVHELVPPAEWKTRYERINVFERLLVEGGTTLVKIFLQISKNEQNFLTTVIVEVLWGGQRLSHA